MSSRWQISLDVLYALQLILIIWTTKYDCKLSNQDHNGVSADLLGNSK